jgi:hypothetical protein
MGDGETPSLRGPRLKLDRAKKHLNDLEEGVNRFFETDPYELFVEDNLEAGQRQHKIRRVDPVPDALGLIAGDVIHNLRSALDHLVWQLVIANGKKPDDMRTEFPVWSKEAGFKKGKPGRAKGISKEALNVLYGLKPYQGGNDALWLLHQLDIVDKHRLLLAVASVAKGVVIDFGGLANEWFDKAPGEAFEPVKIGINAAEPEILAPNIVVFGQPLGSNEHDDVEITIAVSLDEATIPRGEPVVETLSQLSSFVNEVIDLFAPLIPGE